MPSSTGFLQDKQNVGGWLKLLQMKDGSLLVSDEYQVRSSHHLRQSELAAKVRNRSQEQAIAIRWAAMTKTSILASCSNNRGIAARPDRIVRASGTLPG